MDFNGSDFQTMDLIVCYGWWDNSFTILLCVCQYVVYMRVYMISGRRASGINGSYVNSCVENHVCVS